MQTQFPKIESQEGAFTVLSAKRANTLAHEVAEALSQGRNSRVESLALKLQTQLSALKPYLDSSVLRELRETNQVLGPIAQAYGLGQLAFAQLLAANAANTSADDNFVDILKESKHVAYVQALLVGECTSAELKQLVAEREETVSRKLRELRDLGATDFRRDGREVVNFLTPLAYQVASQIYGAALRKDGTSDDPSNVTTKTLRKAKFDKFFNTTLPEHMNEVPIMGSREKSGFANA